MSYIQTTAPEQASGEVADLYQRLKRTSSYVPNYARVFCHRPHVMEPLSVLQETLKQHMDARLWSLVSLAVALEINSSYCSLAFAKRLLRDGFSETELLAITTGAADTPLTDRECAAMRLAVTLARNSSAVTQEDINALRDVGFTDGEIFDVVAAAAWRCFFAKVPDALGARADSALGQLQAGLLQSLLVGRDLETDSHTPLQTQQVASVQ